MGSSRKRFVLMSSRSGWRASNTCNRVRPSPGLSFQVIQPSFLISCRLWGSLTAQASICSLFSCEEESLATILKAVRLSVYMSSATSRCSNSLKVCLMTKAESKPSTSARSSAVTTERATLLHLEDPKWTMFADHV